MAFVVFQTPSRKTIPLPLCVPRLLAPFVAALARLSPPVYDSIRPRRRVLFPLPPPVSTSRRPRRRVLSRLPPPPSRILTPRIFPRRFECWIVVADEGCSHFASPVILSIRFPRSTCSSPMTVCFHFPVSAVGVGVRVLVVGAAWHVTGCAGHDFYTSYFLNGKWKQAIVG